MPIIPEKEMDRMWDKAIYTKELFDVRIKDGHFMLDGKIIIFNIVKKLDNDDLARLEIGLVQLAERLATKVRP